MSDSKEVESVGTFLTVFLTCLLVVILGGAGALFWTMHKQQADWKDRLVEANCPAMPTIMLRKGYQSQYWTLQGEPFYVSRNSQCVFIDKGVLPE